MLRRGVEDKAVKGSAAEEFVATSGRRLLRGDLENPARPGFLKDELVPIEPDVWNAAVRFGLLSPSGRRMGYAPVSADPCTPRRSEVPKHLLDAAAAAWAELERVGAENAAERERIIQAGKERPSDLHLTLDELTLAKANEGAPSSFVMLTAADVAGLERAEQTARAAAAKAEAKVEVWLRHEAIRRERPHACSCGARFVSREEVERHMKDHRSSQRF